VTGPRLLAAVGPAALLLGLAGCGGPAEEPADETVAKLFCLDFPERDAGVALDLVDDPTVGGSADVVASLMDLTASSVASNVPAGLEEPVETYVAALEAYDGSQDPRRDPSVRAAVDEINAWLVAHCPPAAGSAPGTATPTTRR